MNMKIASTTKLALATLLDTRDYEEHKVCPGNRWEKVSAVILDRPQKLEKLK